MSTARQADLEYVGQIVDGRWAVIRLLGVGGMGTVYQAQDRKTHEYVALKRLRPEYVRDKEVVTRFLREGKSGAQMVHPNLVGVKDIGQDPNDGSLYMVQEFLTGMDLRQRMTMGRRLTAEEAVQIIAPVIDGLASAHSYGVVHRDIKPANIFLATEPNGTMVPKVIDFGVSKVLGPASEGMSKTRTGIAVGTPQYMSPEQLRGDKGLDERTDIFSVGVVLYLLLTGKHPYHAQDAAHVMLNILSVEPPRVDQIAKHLSSRLADVVEKSLAKDRGRRYQTMQEFHRALLDAPIFAEGNPASGVLEVSDIVEARETAETHVSDADSDSGPETVAMPTHFEDSVPSHPASVLPQRPSAAPRGRDRALLAIGAALFVVAIVTLVLAIWMRTHESAPANVPSATPPSMGPPTNVAPTPLPPPSAPPSTPMQPSAPSQRPPATPLAPPVTPLH